MRTRSSSESTQMSTSTLMSPKSGSYKPAIYEYQDMVPLEDNVLQPKQPKAIVPTTPFLHKYKTELCKNWEIEGNCAFGETVRFFTLISPVFICSWY